MKKLTIIPETISDLPKVREMERRVHVNLRILESLNKKLNQASIDTGYKKQVLVDRALEAFLK